MKSSIRRTLLAWYAGTLLVIIVGSACAVYLSQREALHEEQAAELRAHLVAITSEFGEVGDIADPESDPTGDEEVRELEDDYVSYFERTVSGSPFLVIFDPDGATRYRSPRAPSIIMPPTPGEITVEGTFRAAARARDGSTIVVGRSTAPMEARLSRLLYLLIFTGLAALVLASLGGWMLVSRVLRPIERMSDSASRISATNTSERIDVGETESELSELASTLNSAFDRLEEALERQRRFTADASHELRTPLSVIRAAVEWSERRERSPDELSEAIASIGRASARMGGLVESLLNLARADAEPHPAAYATFDLSEVAEEAIREGLFLAGQRGVELQRDLAPTLGAGDAERVHMVVSELLLNAVQHAGGGVVQVRTRTHEGTAWLEVLDEGPGIPEGLLSRATERFFRVDPARSRETGGAGLGLAMVEEVVEAHGGRLELANRPEGGFVARLGLRSASSLDEPA